MMFFKLNRAKWRWIALLGLLFVILAASGHADSHSEDVTAQELSGFPSLLQNFANWAAQGVLMGISAVIFVLWICLSWAVWKLYMALGTYLLPIWDFSSGPGTTIFNQAIPSYQCVNSATATIVTQMGFTFFCLSVMFAFVITSADTVKASLGNEDSQRIFIGFAYAFGAMLIYPWLYTGIIAFANDLAQMVQNLTTSAGFTNNGASISNALFRVSIFGTMDPNTQQSLGVGSYAVTQAATPGSLILDPDKTFGQLFATNASYGMWNTIQLYVCASPEIYVSRLIQIVLCIMALLEIVMVLMLKGAQVAGILLNFFLGIIACSLLASPKTRPMFFQWLKGFLELCLWGFIWALLLMATWILIGSISGMVGFDGVTPVGIFLMPFLLFGTIKKFTEVAGIISGIAVNGALAGRVGKAVYDGFNQNSEAGAALTAGSIRTGAGLGSRMVNTIADRASAAALAIPGVGAGLAYAVQAGAKTASTGFNAIGRAGQVATHGVIQPKGQTIKDTLSLGKRWITGVSETHALEQAARGETYQSPHDEIMEKIRRQQKR